MNNKLPLSVLILSDEKDKKMAQLAVKSAFFAKEIILEIKNNITDFSHERNKLAQKASQSWVLFLDSDEIITRESFQILKKIIQENTLDGVLVKRTDIFHEKPLRWGEVRSVWLLRIFQKSKGKFVRPVHEKAIVKGTVKKAPFVLQHTAHASISEFLHDISSYALLEAKFRLEEKRAHISKVSIVLELITFPSVKFLQNFFLRLGFLDGWRGLVYALIMTIHSALVRIYIYENI